MAQWCELPVNLLEELDSHILLYGDKVRIRAVCTSWYTYLPKLPNKKERKFPWLLKEIDNNEVATHALFNPTENKFYYIYLPEAQGKSFKGSSHGWVATVEDKHSTTTTDICLINPLTRALIKLPPRTKFPNVRSYRADKHDQEYALSNDPNFFSCEFMNRSGTTKFVMLSDPSGDCVVVAIYQFGFLACCKSDDKKWKPLHFGEFASLYVDIIVHKGKLHALNTFGEVLCFESIGFGSTKSKVTVVAEQLHIDSSSYLKYLVECSDGGLIMVARCIDFFRDETKINVEPIPCTRYFDVFKLDTNSRWVEVKNIGNDILFLGLNSSFSVPSNHFPSCKGNQIFFADSYYSYDAKGNTQMDADMGVFNLEDRTIQPLKCYPGNFWPPAIWVNAKLSMAEIAATINEFRSWHLSELAELCEASGSSLGYGYSWIMSKPKSQLSDSSDDNQVPEGTLTI